jgi:hypothetical protein
MESELRQDVGRSTVRLRATESAIGKYPFVLWAAVAGGERAVRASGILHVKKVSRMEVDAIVTGE